MRVSSWLRCAAAGAVVVVGATGGPAVAALAPGVPVNGVLTENHPPVCTPLPSVPAAEKAARVASTAYRAAAYGTTPQRAPRVSDAVARSAFAARTAALERADRALAPVGGRTVTARRAAIASQLKAMRGARARLASGTAALAAAKKANGPFSVFGSFRTATWSGRGNAVLPIPSCIGSAVVTFTAAEGSDDMPSLRQEVAGGYDYLLFQALPGESKTGMVWGPPYEYPNPTRSLTISAWPTAGWRVTLSPVSSAPVLTSVRSGHLDGLFLYTGPRARAHLTHHGQSSFGAASRRVGVVPTEDVVRTSHDFDGYGTLPAGPSIVQVWADGDWTFSVAR